MSLKNKATGQDMTIHFSSINQKQQSPIEIGHWGWNKSIVHIFSENFSEAFKLSMLK